MNRWQLRAISYLLLLTDDYPPFEGEHAAHYDVPYPDRPTRWKVVVWKLITAVPHFVALLVLTVGLLAVTVVGWLALVVTGRYPQPLHRYATGVIRWQFRVLGYVQSLTDQFPPFSLRAEAGPASRPAYRLAAAGGLLPVGAAVTGLGLIFAFAGQHVTSEVSYASLLARSPTIDEAQRRPPASEALATVGSGEMQLVAASDPADESLRLFDPEAGSRFVAFTIAIWNWRGAGETVPVTPSAFRLEDAEGERRAPVLVGVDGSAGPGAIRSGERGREWPEGVERGAHVVKGRLGCVAGRIGQSHQQPEQGDEPGAEAGKRKLLGRHGNTIVGTAVGEAPVSGEDATPRGSPSAPSHRA